MLDTIKTYINARYGSRRGLVNSAIAGCQDRFGRFESMRCIDWPRVDRLVFICRGNICRSPLASAVAEQRFKLNAKSYGLDCTDGASADSRAVAFAREIGIDLSGHSAAHIKSYEPLNGDLVIGMEPRHLIELPPRVKSTAQISLIGLWTPISSPYLHDPYSAEDSYFERCERAVVAGVEGVIANLSATGIA